MQYFQAMSGLGSEPRKINSSRSNLSCFAHVVVKPSAISAKVSFPARSCTHERPDGEHKDSQHPGPIEVMSCSHHWRLRLTVMFWNNLAFCQHKRVWKGYKCVLLHFADTLNGEMIEGSPR